MEEALKLLEEIDKVLAFGEGTARVDEASEAETKTKKFLQDTLDPDSLLGRKYEKWSKGAFWKHQSRDGFATSSHLAPLERLREFLTDFLEKKDVKPPPRQQFVKAGEVSTGRQVIRKILGKAKQKVDIQDNYLGIEIFAILHPYFENSANLEARLLTTDSVASAFKSDLAVFAKQFGRIEAKTHDKAHGRFIILDGSEVYSVGHSLKDVGKKADLISKIEVEEERKKAFICLEA